MPKQVRQSRENRSITIDFQNEATYFQLLGDGKAFLESLLLDSRVLRDQQLNERRKQRFASLADVVHEFEEPQVDWEFLLGNAPMRTQPTA